MAVVEGVSDEGVVFVGDRPPGSVEVRCDGCQRRGTGVAPLLAVAVGLDGDAPELWSVSRKRRDRPRPTFLGATSKAAVGHGYTVDASTLRPAKVTAKTWEARCPDSRCRHAQRRNVGKLLDSTAAADRRGETVKYV